MQQVLTRLLRFVLRQLFRAFYGLDLKGIENVPASGAVVLAANHVNYFDAPILQAFTPRPIHFIAASTAFKLPIWRNVMRWFGTIPVEPGRTGKQTIKVSLDVLKRGDVLGIFPEGHFTRDGHFDKPQAGAAYLALRTGAPIVPVTITGAYRSWPRGKRLKRRLPRPWKIVVTFHPPLETTEEEREQYAGDRTVETAVTERLEQALKRTLEPAFRAEKRVARLLRGDPTRVRLYEWFPLFLSVAAVLLLGSRSGGFTDPDATRQALIYLGLFMGVGSLYTLYLITDIYWLRQNATTRAVRAFSPFGFIWLYYPILTRSIPFVRGLRTSIEAPYGHHFAELPGAGIWIDVLFACYPLFVLMAILHARYDYLHHYRVFQRFMRGLLLTFYAALLFILFVPVAGGLYAPIERVVHLGVVAGRAYEWHVNRMVMFDFPVIVVMVNAYLLVFDVMCRHARLARAYALVVILSITSAVLLRGYPLGAVALCFVAVILVVLYLRALPMTAHDGRKA